MSRIGARPIKILENVVLEITPSKVVAKCGELKQELNIPSSLTVTQVEDTVIVNRKDDSRETRVNHGLIARLLNNVIVGVKDGFTKELEFNGTGYRVAVEGETFLLNMGYSHEIKLDIPKGVKVAVKKNQIAITGPDKQVVGQFAAIVRDVRGPEVYKGKGIKYKDEIIRRKAGKKASS